jgi:hypothetical protein
MELVPLLYLGIVYLIATTLGHISRLGFWGTFIINTIFSPIIGVLVYLIYPKNPRALCILGDEKFETGYSYYYIENKIGNEIRYRIFNGEIIEIKEAEFNYKFSKIINKKARC